MLIILKPGRPANADTDERHNSVIELAQVV